MIAVYRVGSKHAWSAIFDFRTFPLDANVTWSPRLALFGDLGLVNGRSLPYLVNASLKNSFDAIIHLGDISYDLFSSQGRTGDAFLNKMQPAAARVPYMVLPGNHEYLPAIGDGGKNFNARFRMPGGDANQYTWTLGPIRFVVLNTEVYFLSEGGNPARAHKQIAWLRAVLKQANARGERQKWPWLVVLQHRPVYCSSPQFGRCPGGQSWVSCFDILRLPLDIVLILLSGQIRQGIQFLSFPGLEEEFVKGAVDLVLSGHNHHYERSYPVYDKRIKVTSMEQPYTNPKAPVYIISGAAVSTLITNCNQ